MRYSIQKSIFFFSVAVLVISCKNSPQKQFELIDESHSNIAFKNDVFGEETLDIMQHYFYHNGAGVVVADFDNDGLQDVFFLGNQVPSRLYKNKGNLEFQDITKESGLYSDFWATGATFVDINSDGKQDLYVCTVGENESNLFYINQGVNENGIPVFKEEAQKYGLDVKQVSVQAAFLDYDKDDDLDVVIAVNSQQMNYRNQLDVDQTVEKSEKINELLFQNNGDGTFTEVSEAAGLTKEGSSLGLAINDLNNDGWPDIYVANDFISNDLLYINNQDGTFTDKTNQYLRHSTFHGMGVDIADVNQDGLMDITVLDMLPVSDWRRKQRQSFINYDFYEETIRQGYNPQFVRNTLQINQGTDDQGNQNFTEQACMSGIYSTDWSWAPLWADYNNDGKKDLYITNGYAKDITDLDHSFRLKMNMMMRTSTDLQKLKIKSQNQTKSIVEVNFLYENTGETQMRDISKESGILEPSISHGAAFVDLDNDGDLELLVNNFRENAFLYKNNTVELLKETEKKNFIKLHLQYQKGNLNALGAKVSVFANNESQSYYHSYVRGYMSSMGEYIHFGLGDASKIDSIQVVWPNQNKQIVRDVVLNGVLEVKYKGKGVKRITTERKVNTQTFKDISAQNGLKYVHEENKFIDFKNSPLLLKMYSREGPSLAVGDINNDGLEDVFTGGASGEQARFFIQTQNEFKQKTVSEDAIFEDMGALFLDVENDGDLDLYVASGGSEFSMNSENYQDRLYVNNGKGKFTRKKAALPTIKSSGGPVKGADYDRDGDIDLFVGGKVNMAKYPVYPRSYLLQNDKGVFTDKTPKGLKKPGMISDAIWSDFDNDGWIDLILVGEWMDVQVFRNDHGNLKKYEAQGLEQSSGFWNSISAGDFDNDGDMDYVVGNLGTNTIFEATETQPLRMYVGDYDQNKKIDPVITYYGDKSDGTKEEMVLHNRDAMNKQIVGFKRKFRDYISYSKAPFRQVLTEKETKGVSVLDVKNLHTSYIENLGNGKFQMKNLPLECQVAPINGMLVKDFNSDGNLDVVMTGNLYAGEAINGRLDASVGVYLLGDGKGNLEPMSAQESGLFLNGDQKSIVNLNFKDKELLLVGCNSGSLKTMEVKQAKIREYIPLKAQDAYAIVKFEDGSQSRQEFYYGNSYLSQTSRKFELTTEMKEVVIFDFKGVSRKIK